MKSIRYAVPFIAGVVTLLTTEWSSTQAAMISYEVSDLGAGRWKYTYEVKNVSLAQPVNEFTIWFNRSRYANLAVASSNPPASTWSELVVQPDPVLHDDGFYDALQTPGGIGIGTSVGGFAVEFDWLATGQPGAQPFDIIDPVSLQTRYSGITVPEPSTLALLALGGLVTIRRQARSSR
ncbi:MAG: PEP-CTERM sorting domain-containing protein [Phycisphaerae bacterium]|nr:PEP-CTERM sorting domain-containing protein [Phycisphaerae bacterium]